MMESNEDKATDTVEEEQKALLVEEGETMPAPSTATLPLIKEASLALPFQLSPKAMIYVYMFLFFGAMVGHEVGMEAATTGYPGAKGVACAITFFQMTLCVLFPLMLSKGKGLENFPRTYPDMAPYIRLSLLVYGATTISTQAVMYVTYPTKVVFKSAKLIPTMVVATVWQGQRYTQIEYLAAFLLCAGAAGYSYGSGNSRQTEDGEEGPSSSAAAIGISMLIVSIICDAIIPNYQKLLLNQGVPVTQLMINLNAVGAIGISAYILLTGQLLDVIRSVSEHPKLLFDMMSVGVCLAIAVWAYTKLIQATSSVVAVAVSTLRKVATIFLSYMIFPKPLLTIHIYSGILVLAGVILSSVAKERMSNKNNS